MPTRPRKAYCTTCGTWAELPTGVGSVAKRRCPKCRRTVIGPADALRLRHITEDQYKAHRGEPTRHGVAIQPK